MNLSFISKYIDLLMPKHIIEYAKSNNIYVSNDESIILCNFIKKNYNELLDNEDKLLELKPMIRNDLFLEIVDLYKKNKKQI